MAKRTKSERKQARAERREKRTSRRAERKEERKIRRAERKKNKTRLIDKIGIEIKNILDKEIEKIKAERLAEAPKEPKDQLDEAALKKMIAKYLLQAVVKAAKDGVLPGFVGMVTVIPEIVATFRNQLRMIYDIGIANGYTDVINNELILFIVIDAVSKKTIGIAIIKDNKIAVKKADETALVALVKLVAGYFVQQLAKSIVAKWLPGLGGAVMAILSKKSTSQIADKTIATFQKEIEKTEEKVSENAFDKFVEEQENEADDEDTDIIKFQVLINLMKKDGEIHPKEKALFSQMLQNADLDQDDKEDLEDHIETPDEFAPDFDYFRKNSDQAIALMIDLVALAKSDQTVSKVEIDYLFEVAKKIGVTQTEVLSLL